MRRASATSDHSVAAKGGKEPLSDSVIGIVTLARRTVTNPDGFDNNLGQIVNYPLFSRLAVRMNGKTNSHIT